MAHCNAADSKTCSAAPPRQNARLSCGCFISLSVLGSENSETSALKGFFGSVELDPVHGVKANSLTLGSSYLLSSH